MPNFSGRLLARGVLHTVLFVGCFLLVGVLVT